MPFPRSVSFCSLVAGLLFFGMPVSATAQSASDALFFAERLPGTGSRLSALAGASGAGVGDYGALYSNPAGLAYLNSSELSGTLRSTLTNNEASYTTSFGDPARPTTTVNDQSRTSYSLGNTALIYKVPTERGSLVLGAALNETRSFGRGLNFQNRNQLSSISDFFLPLNDEVSVQQFPAGESPEELFYGQERITTENSDYLLDFDPNGDGRIERPLSYAAFRTFGIDFYPSLYESGAEESAAFLPVVVEGTQFRQAGDISESGTLREMSFGGAFEGAPDVMFGISANVTFGQYEYQDVLEEVDDQNENDGTNGTTDFDRLRLTRTLRSDLSGFGIRGGLSIDTDPVRLGVTVESPTWYSVSETTDLQLLTLFDNGDRFVYGDDSSEDAGRRNPEYTLRTPWRFGAGVSGEVGSLKLLFDAIVVDWTTMTLNISNGRTIGTELDAKNIFEETFSPVINTRLGAEYTTDPLTVRLGFAYQPAPASFNDIQDEQRIAQLNLQGADEVGQRERYYGTAGLGYQISNQLALDLSWMLERFRDRTLPYESPNASFVNETITRNRVQFGLRYSF